MTRKPTGFGLPGLALTAMGLGLLRPAPGTWGSLPPVAVGLVLAASGAGPLMVSAGLVLLVIAGSVACVRFGDWAELRWGKKDPGCVVADEVAGQAITLLAVPWVVPVDSDGWAHNLWWSGGAFLLFRLFDILKPPPIRGVQSLRGGWGILVDDLLAGAMAALVLVAVRVALG